MKTFTIKMQRSRLISYLFVATFFLNFSSRIIAQPTGQYVYLQKLSDAIEGGKNGIYKIGLHYPVPLAEDVIVAYSFLASGQATMGPDFVHLPAYTGNAVIPAGSTQVLIDVDAFNDGIIEGPESTGIQITSAASATLTLPIDPANNQAQVNIIDANAASSTPVQLLIGTNAAEPSGQATFTLKLAGVATSAWPVHIAYVLSGTASPGVDCQSIGALVIPPNTNSITVSVNMYDDHIIEGQENLRVTLLSGSATDGGGNAFIFPPDPVNTAIDVLFTDDDYTAANTQITLTKIADAAEPASSGIIRMSLPGDYVPSTSLVANIQYGGTATGADYANSAAILLAYHNTADVSLTAIDDTLVEETETILCTLLGASDANSLQYTGAPSQNVASVDIVDDDANLPLRLVSFAGNRLDGGAVRLKWATADEENTSHFEILKSSDGHTFGQIGVISASGSGNHDYTFTDPDPGPGNFYRLRMIDQDGSFTYSRVISIAIDHGQSISVFPNPANSRLTVDLGSSNLLPRKATVVDIHGRFYKQVRLNGSRSVIPIAGLKSGVYLLLVENGESVRFIVQ
ncbi:Calx-beta domain-containing protein [Dyadobacter sp. BHUBP1]|uniref:Calx-beta domain-containing protein n=1 Tax=Dyadobacter sp. BHUBP1 TaxID=3424178 RepID=UPI003D3561C0